MCILMLKVMSRMNITVLVVFPCDLNFIHNMMMTSTETVDVKLARSNTKEEQEQELY